MSFYSNKQLFSFKLDGIDSKDLNCKISATVDDNITTTVYDYDGGLRITNIFKKYDDFGAYEWVNYYENTSNEPTGILSDVFDCDVLVPLENDVDDLGAVWLPDRDDCTKIYAPCGSTCSPEEFYSDADSHGMTYFKQGDQLNRYSLSGRPSEVHAPFYNINKKDKGYICAIGWSGRWDSLIDRLDGAVRLRFGVLGAKFRVLPGEKFRTASVVILPYSSGYDESHVSWRRLVKTHFSNMGKGQRPSYMPMGAWTWGGLTTEKIIERLELIKKYSLPFEVFWLDVGWYGINSLPTADGTADWSSAVGDWRVSPNVHKNGLQDITKLVHDMGMKFLLWFEPERANVNSPIVQEHPEYFMINPNSSSAFINLGREDAWNYAFETFSNKITELNIDIFRIDCNLDMAPFWEMCDEPDRRCITQIKYVNGLYKLWDALLERFPALIIDNCAGGGRRIDIETMRRSVPFWRSDLQLLANARSEHTQLHTQTFAQWMPYSGTGTTYDFDEYKFRSIYCGGLNPMWTVPTGDMCIDLESQGAEIKKYMEEYLSLRDYFYSDYYPLTEFNANRDTWCASQYNRPEDGDGIVIVYRRENSPFKTSEFILKGLELGSKYRFDDIDGGESIILDADKLLSDGFEVTIPQKRKAKIYVYHKL